MDLKLPAGTLHTALYIFSLFCMIGLCYTDFFFRKTLQVLFSYNLIFPPLSPPTSLLPFFLSFFMFLRHLFIFRISNTFTGASLVAQHMH